MIMRLLTGSCGRSINILGGVDVELSKAEFYYINSYITETVESTGVGSHHLKKAGPNHLDGVQAVAYARLRKMDTDYARTERQRKVIELSFDKLKKADFAVVNNVMEVVFPQILTSITLNDMIPMAKNLTKYHIAATAGFPEARSDGILGKKGACVIPQTLESNVIKLHQFLFDDENYVPSEMVKRSAPKFQLILVCTRKESLSRAWEQTEAMCRRLLRSSDKGRNERKRD